MKVGDVSEGIEVSASAAILQTENGAGKIVELPLNGRNFIRLAQLLPGVQAGTPGSITVRRGRGSVGQQDSARGRAGNSRRRDYRQHHRPAQRVLQ